MELQPFKKYKDSGLQWAKRIPEKWEVHKIKFLLQIPVTDGPHETPEFIDEGIPFLSVDSIQEGEIIFEGCRFISKEDHIRYKIKCHPEKNDVFMGKAASIGKIAMVKVDFPFNIWSPLALLRTNKKINSSFFEYALKSDYSQDQIDNFSTSNTQKNISMDDIPRIQIIIPLIEEQTIITKFLDSKIVQINQTIEKDKQLIDLLKEKRTALINHIVTKGLDPKVKMKDSGVEWIGKIPETWETWKLAHIAKIYSGGTPDKTKEFYWENGEIPWISSGEVNQEDITIPTTLISKEGFYNSSAKWIPKDSLILALAGQGKTKGTVAYLRIRTTGNQSLAAIVPTKVNSRYLFYWLKRNYYNIRGLAGEGIRDGLNLDIIKQIKVPMPSQNEQKKIAKYLDLLNQKNDQIVKIIEQKIELLEEYKKSLIHHVVTGKVDVRSAVV